MIAWDRITTVLLDMDGTLLDLHFDNYFWKEYLPAKWGAHRGLDLERAKAVLLPRLESRQGTLSWYCLDYWSKELQIDILELKSDIEHLIQLRPHAREFLGAVAGLGKRLILVTNSHEKLLARKLARTGIAPCFDAIVSAHVYGRPKEEVDFWSRLHAEHAFDPPATLLIDDNQAVLRAAGSFGIRHLYTIRQPDSHAPPRESSDFPAIASFAELVTP